MNVMVSESESASVFVSESERVRVRVRVSESVSGCRSGSVRESEKCRVGSGGVEESGECVWVSLSRRSKIA